MLQDIDYWSSGEYRLVAGCSCCLTPFSWRVLYVTLTVDPGVTKMDPGRIATGVPLIVYNYIITGFAMSIHILAILNL
jgi:hypothetical protein